VRRPADSCGRIAPAARTGQRAHDGGSALQEPIMHHAYQSLALNHPDAFELRFQSLFHQGRAMSFPCDAEGHVDLDALSERARENYFYARAVVGREYAVLAVCPTR
jgi:hypothetical protein